MRIKPKKRLGQNFLADRNIQKKIVDSLGLGPDDTVVEIGPGRGELTVLLAEKAKRVFAIEIDPLLCELLNQRLSACKNVEIIKGDILKFNLAGFLGKVTGKRRRRVKVVGNLPYYITTPIIEMLLGCRDYIESIFITVQKEFGERIIASAGSKEYGSFSCLLKYHTVCRRLFSIKRGSFFPAPKVDSCFLRLDVRPEPCVRVREEDRLFKIIRTAFNYRRKTLRNSLKGVVPAERLDSFFEINKIDTDIRPEDLSLEDFANLANIVT